MQPFWLLLVLLTATALVAPLAVLAEADAA
jgi:hypothetical protein